MKVKHVLMIAAVMLALIAAPASAASETILGYDVPETYSIIIPAAMAFDVDNSITVKGSIASSTTLTVSVDSENNWYVHNSGDSVGYSMTVDDVQIQTSGEIDAVAILTGLLSTEVAGNGKTSNLKFALLGEATKAGKYTDKLTFSVEVIRAIDAFKTALSSGNSVTLSEDIINSENTLDTRLLASISGTTINLGSKEIIQTAKQTAGSISEQNCVGLLVSGENVVLNANADGGITAPGHYAIYVIDGGSLTINGGTYKGATTVVQVYSGNVTIKSGFFEAKPYKGAHTYTLNCIDDNYISGAADIIVYGGTFVNFNPADNAAEGPNTNFVALGYTVTSEEQPNGDIWYTVVKETSSST